MTAAADCIAPDQPVLHLTFLTLKIPPPAAMWPLVRILWPRVTSNMPLMCTCCCYTVSGRTSGMLEKEKSTSS